MRAYVTFEMSTKTLQAGLSTPIDRKMVAPSFVMSTRPFSPSDKRILSMPFGPRVLLTKSPTAIAPTKDERRACSAFSSSAPDFMIWIGLRGFCTWLMLNIVKKRTRRKIEKIEKVKRRQSDKVTK